MEVRLTRRLPAPRNEDEAALRRVPRVPLGLETDESYRMHIKSSQTIIEAPTDVGLVYALESLAQLIRFDYERERYYWPSHCEIEDAPRFPHRGLLLDSGRHFLPV